MNKDNKTPVIIRQSRKGGDLIAIFSEELGTDEAWTCMCYQAIGQHGHGDVNAMIERSKRCMRDPQQGDDGHRPATRPPSVNPVDGLVADTLRKDYIMKKILVRDAGEHIVAFDINSKRKGAWPVEYDVLVISKATLETRQETYPREALSNLPISYLSVQPEGIQNYIEIWRDEMKKPLVFNCGSKTTMFIHVAGLAMKKYSEHIDNNAEHNQKQPAILKWAIKRYIPGLDAFDVMMLCNDIRCGIVKA